MGGLVVSLVVVDAEGQVSRCSGGRADASDLRVEEARGHRGHHDEGADAMRLGNIGAKREARDLRVIPFDGEGDRRCTQDAEVVGVVGVLPDVVSAEDEVFAEGLLEAGMELVAEAGVEGRGRALAERLEDGLEHGVGATVGGENKVLVEGSLHGSCVGGSEYSVGPFEVVGEADTRLGLTLNGEAVVKVATNTDVEEPVARRDLVLSVEGELLDVRLAMPRVVVPLRVRS